MSECKDCKFWLKITPPQMIAAGPKLGVCRRFPPVWLNDKIGWAFPTMQDIGWCGEFSNASLN